MQEGQPSRAREWGGDLALTFLGCVPVECQPGEVEHSYEPAVSAEGVHKDGAAGHSWWGTDGHRSGPVLLAGSQAPLYW